MSKTIVQNVFALSSVQLVNYFIPLILIPFLSRTLGVKGFGLYALFHSFAIYTSSIIEYNFAFWGTRETARVRNDEAKRSRLFYSIISAKCILILLSAVGFFFIYLYYPVFNHNPRLVVSAFLWAAALGSNLIWYFQGMEKLKLVALIEFFSRAAATIFVFLFIRSIDDLWLVFLFYAASSLISLLISGFIASREIKWYPVPASEVIKTLRSAFYLFQTRLAGNIYQAANPLLLGFFTNPAVVGVYSGAEKIVRAANVIVFEPINRTIFPKQSHLMFKDPERSIKLIRYALLTEFALGVILCGILWFSAPVLVKFILGEGFEKSIMPMRILAFISPFIAISSVLGNQWLLPLGYDRAFTISIWIAAIVDLVGIIVFVPIWMCNGMAFVVLVVELSLVLCFFFILLRKKKIRMIFESKDRNNL